MEKKAVFVARDYTPSETFKRLIPALEALGYEVTTFMGGGKPIENLDRLPSAISKASVVLIGMSSSAYLAEPEIKAAKEAGRRRVPYGFYGNAKRMWGSALPGGYFAGVAKEASFYMGVDQKDADEAHLAFPNAKLFGTGNPLREEWAFPSITREQARKQLGIAEGETLIVSTSGKLTGSNMAVLSIVIDALSMMDVSFKKKMRFLATFHPGDRARFAVDPKGGQELMLYERFLSFSPVQVIIDTTSEASVIIAAADMVITGELGSETGIEAAYRRIPVIGLDTSILVKQLELMRGVRVPEAVESKISAFVPGSPAILAEYIETLLTPEGFAEMRKNQERVCFIPEEKGLALQKMADAISIILEK